MINPIPPRTTYRVTNPVVRLTPLPWHRAYPFIMPGGIMDPKILTFDTPDEAGEAMASDRVCRDIGAVLQKHYPGRLWHVHTSVRGGVAQIQCPSISTLYGYTLHIHNKTHDQLRDAVVRAGGQLLEMFKLSRHREAQGGEELLARDTRGEAIHAATGL